MNSTRDPRPLVVHVVYRLSVGGLENVVANLINGLPRNAYRHAVIALMDITDFRERITRDDVEYVALDKGPGHAVKLYPQFVRYFRRAEPSIVHTCNLAALEAVVPAWFARVPVRVHAEHGWDVHDKDGSNRKYRLLRRIYRPFVNHYIAVSSQLRQYLVDAIGVRPRHVSLIANGVDTDRFVPAAHEIEEVAGYPFSVRDHWVVGTVGRMQDVKNQTLLARAFIRALQIEPAAAKTLRLVMIGDGPLRKQATQLLTAEAVGHLAWLPGECAAVAPLMRKMNCFVLPSLTEGTSCTVQEAMASALPVVATDVGGNANLVAHGVTGTLIPSGDVDAMTAAILLYWRNRAVAERHGVAGRARARDSFSLNAMIEAYDRLFSETLTSADANAFLRPV